MRSIGLSTLEQEKWRHKQQHIQQTKTAATQVAARGMEWPHQSNTTTGGVFLEITEVSTSIREQFIYCNC